ncbi:MAG: restriction endonuclease subunit S [Streptococcus sp.]|uniref:restriction endonuclease subunit S n=1 Tax=Streptococcus sp. TaxID=1306 RepID=UPI0029096F54|nr:restriction endonuclease subunit S [Streptococcus sp.]MDU5072097.1 restriction endonuclease subunit S [Streptococcus sp.]
MTRMKESGVDWIGQIPEEWGVIKFKYLGDVKQGLTYSPSDIVDKDEGILVLRSGNIQNGILDFNNNVYVKTKVAESIVLRKNDILITARNGSPALIGKNAIIDTDITATFGAFMMVFRANKSLFSKFAFYLMNVSFNFYRTFFTTSTVNQLTAAIFNGIEVPLPSISEQQKIADFLDKKTAQLDKAKALLEKQIQKLKDYRASLIYETVTKGLDKTVTMKDSGIDWIGQVPEGWEISKIRYLVTTRSEKRITDSSIPYIGLENIESQTGKFVETGIQVDKSENIVVEIGDVLFGKLRPYLRKFWRATFPSTASSEFLVFQSSELDMNFLYYAIQSDSFIEEVNTSTYGSKMPRASWEYIKNMKITFPSSLVEQQKIANLLYEKTAQIDNLIQIKNQQIKNINKQRQTLIYDYVTGKRRV